ncbi:MAG: hypothetical protein ACSLEN_03450 [Candidatus Malihini olakiniferum]
MVISTCQKNLVTPTAGWKSYLVNEETIQRVATFKPQVMDLRTELPAKSKQIVNFEVANINISSMPKKLAGHNLIEIEGNGFVRAGK